MKALQTHLHEEFDFHYLAMGEISEFKLLKYIREPMQPNK